MSDPRLLGDYRLEEVLGEGAVGVVHRARAPDGTLAVVKILRPELAADDAYRLRFDREVRVAQEVRDRHLVAVLAVGEADGVPFLVLEHVPGGSLADRLRGGPLSVVDTVALVADVAAGLDTLHRRSLVHRDVKPSNILLREDGTAVLTDFGLAKGAASTVLTRAGQAVGTLDYMAPELLRGEEATPASDVYALGCVAYECLSGAPPFADRSLFGIGTAHLQDEVAEPPGPPDVGWAVLRALAKDADDRPPTATAYAHLLQTAARSARSA